MATVTSPADVVVRCEAGEISPAIALMELLIATENADDVAALLQIVGPRSCRAKELQALFAQHEDGCRRVAAMLQADVDRPPEGASIEQGVAFARALFDWSVQQSEHASVALYSLGSPEILAAATAEIVELLRRCSLLDRGKTALDLGCGTGRIEDALAGELAHIHGIDVSSEMVRAARRRCSRLGNVTISETSGLDLAPFANATFDLMLAVDSFPYVVQAGWPLVENMFGEAWRVLRAAGELVILNFSYRGDRHRDRHDAQELATRHGFALLMNGEQPFRLWNGDAYRFRKAGRPALTSV